MRSGVQLAAVFLGKDSLECLFYIQVWLAQVERVRGVAGGDVQLLDDLAYVSFQTRIEVAQEGVKMNSQSRFVDQYR